MASDDSGATRPDLSVVVAVWGDTAGLARCLEALAPQVDERVEVRIVSNVEVHEELRARHPWALWLRAGDDALVPVLWFRGIEPSRGDLVALTTAHFEPRSDWIARIRDAARRDAAVGIGGAIDAPRGQGPVAWATYFLRYSNYFHIVDEGVVGEIAGDNAAYRRDALERHRDVIADGFWEPDFHRVVLREGHHLLYVPEIRVTQIASHGFGTFCRQRFHHGTQFGSARVKGRGSLERALRLASVPAVPVVFLAKICARAVRRPRALAKFVQALPVLTAFVLCWTVGEARGYWKG